MVMAQVSGLCQMLTLRCLSSVVQICRLTQEYKEEALLDQTTTPALVEEVLWYKIRFKWMMIKMEDYPDNLHLDT
jgi:hypothetical protein